MTQSSEPAAGSDEPGPAQGYPPPGQPVSATPGTLPPGPPQPGFPQPGFPPSGYPLAGYGPMVPLGIAPNGQPLASFVDRLLAYLIDSAILAGIAFVVDIPVIVIAVVSLVHSQAVNADGTVNGASPAFFLAVLAVTGGLIVVNIAATYVYHVEMMYRSGQTVGKRTMKLRIVCLDSGTPMTRATAAKRWLIGQVVAVIVGIVGLIDGLWQLWDQPFRQCLHDKVARTVVVKQAT